MNIDAIIKYKRPEESYYDILGCHQSSSAEQISREYKIRALKLHPDKNPDPEAAKRFQILQVAKDTLTNKTLRKSYDTWLNSGIQIPFEQWQMKKNHSMHWAPPRNLRLSIQQTTNPSQDDNKPGSTIREANTLLEKFRKYEI